jgi:nucleotide-binding universal stress UspA family protein
MYQRILILVDDREVSRHTVSQGVEMARVHGAEVVFFHALPNLDPMALSLPETMMMMPEGYEERVREAAADLLQQASAMADAAGVVNSRSMEVCMGHGISEAQWVAERADKEHCDLIVVGTESRNALVRLIGGSIVPGLVTHANVPLLICREPHTA